MRFPECTLSRTLASLPVLRQNRLSSAFSPGTAAVPGDFFVYQGNPVRDAVLSERRGGDVREENGKSGKKYCFLCPIVVSLHRK